MERAVTEPAFRVVRLNCRVGGFANCHGNKDNGICSRICRTLKDRTATEQWVDGIWTSMPAG